MGLKLKLRGGESAYISGALIRNGSSSVELEILNKVPILREKDIMLESEVRTPCDQVYFLVQTLYLQPGNEAELIGLLSSLTVDIVKAAPSISSIVESVHDRVAFKAYFDALKCARRLIDYESSLLNHAKANQ
jgi:flagellar protein FlbT